MNTRVLPLLLIAFGLFYLLPMATHGLWIPDETRYAQVSQEMLLSGNWITPHFMGIRYFEKPVAGYWMIALGQALFGENLFGVRFASALSTGLSVLLAYLIARRLWNDPRRSAACAVIYMSFAVIAGQAGYANLDPQFTFWVNLSLVALWYALDTPSQRSRIGAWALLGFACGMGFMTKGFLAWLLPVLIALPYMIWHKRLSELLTYGGIAVVVAIAVCLPWVLAIHSQEPDYWRYFFWQEHIRRFSADDAQHARPWWFYLPLLVALSLPWAALLPFSLKQAWHDRERKDTRFLLLWLLLPLAFFSLSRGKLPTYIMPCLLPLALLVGNTLVGQLERLQGRVLRINGVVNLVLGVGALLALVFIQLKKPVYVNEPEHLSLVLVALVGWTLCNGLQVFRPLRFWVAPALGVWLLVALAPPGLPNSVVYNKMPDAFIADHLDELKQTQSLLSNDLGAASALAWRLRKPEVALYNTIGEVKYGIAYMDTRHRRVDTNQIDEWMSDARRRGSVGVVMRVKSKDELHEVDLLPKEGKRYAQGSIVIFIIPASQP